MKQLFKDQIVSYLKSNESGFRFRVMTFDNPNLLKEFVNENFRVLLGSVIRISNTTLLFAEDTEYADSNGEYKRVASQFEDEFDW